MKMVGNYLIFMENLLQECTHIRNRREKDGKDANDYRKLLK